MDAMTDKIEPALSAQRWRDDVIPGGVAAPYWIFAEQAPEFIALLNHALPNDDPRKITRETLDELRSVVRTHEHDRGGSVAAEIAFLDALESYLPPE